MTTQFYCSTYCNKAHRVVDGKPIGHECRVIPPTALAAEMRGDFDAAQAILAGARTVVHRGVKVASRAG